MIKKQPKTRVKVGRYNSRIGHKVEIDSNIVIKALENKNYDWRTINGIAAETKIPEVEVSKILSGLVKDGKIVVSSKTDQNGGHLYTTYGNYKTRRSTVNKILSALADKVK